MQYTNSVNVIMTGDWLESSLEHGTANIFRWECLEFFSKVPVVSDEFIVKWRRPQIVYASTKKAHLPILNLI